MSGGKSWQTILKEHHEKVSRWASNEELRKAVHKIAKQHKKLYKVENSVVFNSALEKVDPKEVKYILVGDNPGIEEQRTGYYFAETGLSGKLARMFFQATSLVNCFDYEVLVLNKTPIHTPATKDLRKLDVDGILEKSQEHMVELIHEIMEALPKAEVWVVGISEMRKNGIFQSFSEKLLCEDSHISQRISVFKHFSNGGFFKDLKSYPDPSLKESLKKIGKENLESVHRSFHVTKG